jgi:hypothetical protein
MHIQPGEAKHQYMMCGIHGAACCAACTHTNSEEEPTATYVIASIPVLQFFHIQVHHQHTPSLFPSLLLTTHTLIHQVIKSQSHHTLSYHSLHHHDIIHDSHSLL